MQLFSPPKTGQVRVWDPLLRFFHWSLVLFFFLAYLTEDDWLYLHSFAGYTLGGLLIFRLCWGLIGTRYARFSSFDIRRASLLAYLKSLLTRHPRHYLGHNPAGALMIVVMLALLSLTVVSGILTLGAEGLGPLANTTLARLSGKWMEELHEGAANLMLALVAIHVAGVLVSSLLHRENLVKSMINGNKTHPGEGSV